MRMRLQVALAIIALTATPVASFADRAHDLAKQASKVEVEQCDADVTTFSVCHLNYPTGCTHSPSGSYDAYLNFLKNQTPLPASAVTRLLAQRDFQALERGLPSTLGRGNHWKHAADLADLGEGNIAAVIGYLYYAQPGGRKETSNCQLTRSADIDYHIGLGFEAGVAAGLRTRARASATVPPSVQQSSIIVEMTPHYRAQYHPRWTLPLVQRYVGRQVKVVGQMLVDNEHLLSKDDCGLPGAGPKCWRASVWELHPVIQFYVCTAASPCAANSANWIRIDDEP